MTAGLPARRSGATHEGAILTTRISPCRFLPRPPDNRLAAELVAPLCLTTAVRPAGLRRSGRQLIWSPRRDAREREIRNTRPPQGCG